MVRPQALVPVTRVKCVLGVRVEFLEGFGAVQEEVEEHGVRHQFGDLPNGLVLNLKPGKPPQHLNHYQQNGRAGTESRCQKLRRQDGRIPIGAGRQSVIEKRRHGVDAHGHGNGQQHQRHYQTLDVMAAVKCPVQNVGGHHEVHYEIKVEHDYIPGQNGAREVEVAEGRNQMPETVGTPDIHHDEHQAHHDRTDGQQFSVDHDFPDGLPVVDVLNLYFI